MPSVASVLDEHVRLQLRCVDRLYLNGYLPGMQIGNQLKWFLIRQRGCAVPSPAILGAMGKAYRAEVERFAEREGVPLIEFERGERKDDVAARYRAKFRREEGVVFVGTAQERQRSFRAIKSRLPSGLTDFDYAPRTVYVTHYYFYLEDRDWGPAFVKVGRYVPFPVRVCLNGHEWAKRRARRERLRFSALDNGFLSCSNAERLQAICDELGPEDVRTFFDRWSHRLPWPLTAKDRAAGYEHRLSIWQMELSLTHVFDRPVQGRHFFEEVIRENLDLGRPDRVSLLFRIRHTRRTRPPEHGYRTRIFTQGVDPSLHVEYRSSHVKQYFKEQRALRTETTINDTHDFGLGKDLRHFDQLRREGERVNRQLLESERISQRCLLSQAALDRVTRPTECGTQRVSGLRFGDPRAMAVLQALTAFATLPTGFRNRDLRTRVAALLGLSLEQYTRNQMTYDLRRLRLKGLVARISETQRYTVTTFGLQVAMLFSKLYLRVLRIGTGQLELPADRLPPQLHRALVTLDREITKLIDAARLDAA